MKSFEVEVSARDATFDALGTIRVRNHPLISAIQLDPRTSEIRLRIAEEDQEFPEK